MQYNKLNAKITLLYLIVGERWYNIKQNRIFEENLKMTGRNKTRIDIFHKFFGVSKWQKRWLMTYIRKIIA